MRPWHLFRALRALDRGGIIAYPTEAVWGLGCDPFDHRAVQRLLNLKKRSYSRGLILVAGDIAQFEPFLRGLDAKSVSRLSLAWPGPTTFLVPDNGYAPTWIKGDFATVALRVVDHPLVAQLCEAFDSPIVSTSANPSGAEPARALAQCRNYFAKSVDYYVPGDTQGFEHPSKIIDLVSGHRLR